MGANSADAASGGPHHTKTWAFVRLGKRKCGISACQRVAIFGQVLPGGSYRRRCAAHRDTQDGDLSRRNCSVAGCPRRSAGRARAPGLEGHERLCLQHAHVSAFPEDDDEDELSHPSSKLAAQGLGPAPPLRCFFPLGGGGCPLTARYGDNENGVALFCKKHRAPYHVDLGLSARWASSEGCDFVAIKRSRAHLVRTKQRG